MPYIQIQSFDSLQRVIKNMSKKQMHNNTHKSKQNVYLKKYIPINSNTNKTFLEDVNIKTFIPISPFKLSSGNCYETVNKGNKVLVYIDNSNVHRDHYFIFYKNESKRNVKGGKSSISKYKKRKSKRKNSMNGTKKRKIRHHRNIHNSHNTRNSRNSRNIQKIH